MTMRKHRPAAPSRIVASGRSAASALFVVSSLFLSLLPPSASAEPFLLLQSTQPKCVNVEAPADTTLHILYDAPDLVELDTPGEEEPFMDEKELARHGADMANRMWQEHQKNKDPKQTGEYMKRQRFRTTITVSQKPDMRNRGGPGDKRARRNREKDRRNKPMNVREDLKTKKGTVTFDTTSDGQVQICVQSMTASTVNPTPISLHITEAPKDARDVPGAAASAELQEGQEAAEQHLSRMERTLLGLISKTDMILQQADYAKELEVDFHEQSLAMNRASQWWPIVQLCVLLVTGFTQANHMVRFFKSHHIF